MTVGFVRICVFDGMIIGTGIVAPHKYFTITRVHVARGAGAGPGVDLLLKEAQ